LTAVLLLVASLALQTSGQSILCVMAHCLPSITQCYLDSECKAVLDCLSKCDPEDGTCPYVCGMGGEAGKNEHFLALLYCLVDNDCMPKYPASGVCLAEDSQALDTKDFSLVAGDWWTVYGQSCGQLDTMGDWSGSHDWVPCSHARFLPRLEQQDWINNTTFCVGSDSVCQGDLLVTVPVVYWTNPGVLRHDYPQSEAPIVPQIEDWKWMWVSEDNNWAVVVWCGYNPVLDYNGGFVLSRTRSDGTIPTELEPVIREELAKYGMDLDSMCLTDSTGCVE